VYNRPIVSGTNKTFRTIVLGGNSFGSTTNITSLAQDATTPMLRLLGSDGIGYATFGQVVDQRTVRVLAIDGTTWKRIPTRSSVLCSMPTANRLIQR
jgi:phosphate transport system substrate-binding protein